VTKGRLRNRKRTKEGMTTVAMHDARWLRESLHPKDGPEIDRRKWVFPVRRVSTQHQQVIAEYPKEGTWGLFRRETFYLNWGSITLAIDYLESNCGLAHDSCQQERTIHDKAPERKNEFLRVLIRLRTYLWGCTRGLGNFPLILDCHWTSFDRDSDSRFPSFMFVANDEISSRAWSRGSK